jgi:hypothetical protein
MLVSSATRLFPSHSFQTSAHISVSYVRDLAILILLSEEYNAA